MVADDDLPDYGVHDPSERPSFAELSDARHPRCASPGCTVRLTIRESVARGVCFACLANAEEAAHREDAWRDGFAAGARAARERVGITDRGATALADHARALARAAGQPRRAA